MPEFTQWIDIDVEEYYDEMSKQDKEEMLELLKQDFTVEQEDYSGSPAQEIFNEAMDKIKARRLQLPIYQEQMLLDLANSL